MSKSLQNNPQNYFQKLFYEKTHKWSLRVCLVTIFENKFMFSIIKNKKKTEKIRLATRNYFLFYVFKNKKYQIYKKYF